MELKSKFILVTAIISYVFLSEEMHGQKRGPQNKRVNPNTSRYDGNRYRVQPIPRKPRVRYPRHRRVVPRLPYGHRRVYYGGLHFYFHAGIFYSAYNDGYVVVLPPAGFRITVLPVGYTRIMVGPSVYFYYGGVYYIEKEEEDVDEKYEVVDAPVGAIVEELPEEAEEVMIDGKSYYDHHGIMYKKLYLKDGLVKYEVVYVN